MSQRTQLQISTHPLLKGLGDRQTSLLPGQVRTPNLPAYSPITDWAATSTVWDEEEETGTRGKVTVSREDSHYPPSITTPLEMYQKSEVWSSESGLHRGAPCSFMDVPQQLSNTTAKASNVCNSTPLLPAATTKKGGRGANNASQYDIREQNIRRKCGSFDIIRESIGFSGKGGRGGGNGGERGGDGRRCWTRILVKSIFLAGRIYVHGKLHQISSHTLTSCLQPRGCCSECDCSSRAAHVNCLRGGLYHEGSITTATVV
ncbi:hypothetical protein MOQ_001588 [Trypanosoma cruzi marinkellei]|uniref:Uncharacterized protein n=1 Tax=Trypanosoma cruzi marinkellei TaxID=85056 RepID=K2NFX4_TRYCR|nr:hypothetical protein MOQ_001588 [Trypanosoma cruzi marinkellei]